MTTGTELLVADATVAEVYLRLMLYRFMLNVLLQKVQKENTTYIHVIYVYNMVLTISSCIQ